VAESWQGDFSDEIMKIADFQKKTVEQKSEFFYNYAMIQNPSSHFFGHGFLDIPIT
jgi:hypothetical protein